MSTDLYLEGTIQFFSPELRIEINYPYYTSVGEETWLGDGWSGIKSENKRERGFEDCIEQNETASDRL